MGEDISVAGVERVNAYYNENDPRAAEWLRELMAGGLIAAGDVDERSIEDVTKRDLEGYGQCHFFAGIGGWSLALRRAGWPDDRPVWTGSCPCQPFSAAGKGNGVADNRHLWPAFDWLIGQCCPDVVFGEQVAGRAGLGWLDLVSNALEGRGYAVGAAVTTACSVGAPHLRRRLYWVANAQGGRRSEGCENGRGGGPGDPTEGQPAGPLRRQPFIEVANASGERPQRRGERRDSEEQRTAWEGCVGSEGRGPTNGPWQDADWLSCRDGKWRPVEPGTFPLADGIPERVGLLRGYGNAVVVPQAEDFVMAYLEEENA